MKFKKTGEDDKEAMMQFVGKWRFFRANKTAGFCGQSTPDALREF